jgi:hypothetical protein
MGQEMIDRGILSMQQEHGITVKEKLTAEEILNCLLLFFIKRPKGLLILGAIIAVVVSFMYFSFIRSQNEVLISSLSILKDMSVISENANKRVLEIERAVNSVLDTANKSQILIEEKISVLTEVERRFHEKREAIQKLREENDKLLIELKNAVEEAKENLGRISEQRDKAFDKVHEIDIQRNKVNQKLYEIDVQQKMLKGTVR